MLLLVLIVSPVTAPFSAVSGGLEASPSGPADDVKSETSTDATVEAVAVHGGQSCWVLSAGEGGAPAAGVVVTSSHRVLRL